MKFNLRSRIAFTIIGFILFIPVISFSQTFGNALEFDGLDDFVFVGNDTSLQVDKFTLTAWVHPYTYSEPIPEEQRMEIFEKAGEYWMNISTTDAGYQREIGEVRVGGIFEGQWHFLDSEYIVPLNEWTHISCTYDLDSLVLYINGTFEAAKAIPENHTDKLETDNMLALGCKCVKGPDDKIEAQFHGMLDEMSIWNTALPQNEVAQLMNEGIEQSHSKWSDLRAYYKVDEDKVGENLGEVKDEIGLHTGDNYGAFWVSNNLTTSTAIVSLSKDIGLKQNYPNPFSDFTFIPIDINKTTRVKVDIYDLTGHHVQNLANEIMQMGDHTIKWDASGISGGIYFYQVSIGGIKRTRKCLVNN